VGKAEHGQGREALWLGSIQLLKLNLRAKGKLILDPLLRSSDLFSATQPGDNLFSLLRVRMQGIDTCVGECVTFFPREGMVVDQYPFLLEIVNDHRLE
jgi:hypothetical protein